MDLEELLQNQLKLILFSFENNQKKTTAFSNITTNF